MAVRHPILEIGKSDHNIPFEMHTMQWIDQNRGLQNSVPHRHNYFTIIWVKNGFGVHFIDVNKYNIEKDTVYCLSPGQIHLLKASEDIDGYVISFTSDFLCFAEENFDLLFNSGLFYAFSQTPAIHLTEEMQSELEDVAQKMLKEFENFFLLRAEILRGYLKIFLIYLTRQFKQSEKGGKHARNLELLKNFFALLEKNYTSKKMVAEYAADLAVTPNYLNEVVKKVSGWPASDHIKQRVVLEAKRQAAYSKVSMKEIAYNLGFDDVTHFSKYFKNTTGINFSDFKKSTDLMINN